MYEQNMTGTNIHLKLSTRGAGRDARLKTWWYEAVTDKEYKFFWVNWGFDRRIKAGAADGTFPESSEFISEPVESSTWKMIGGSLLYITNNAADQFHF